MGVILDIRKEILDTHTTERKSTPLTRIGTMLLACLGLYPQVGSDLDMITISFSAPVAKCLYIFLAALAALYLTWVSQ